MLSERGHDSAHLLHSALALESEVEKNVLVVAVFFIYLGHLLGESLALRFIICRHLADKERGDYRILVSRVQAREITVALFHAENESVALVFLFEIGRKFADIFKSGQHIVYRAAVALRDAVNERGRYERLDYNGVFGQSASLFHRRENILGQQNADFVAAHEPVIVSGVDGDADAVAVGVGREKQIDILALGELQSLFKSLTNLGVRIGAGREVAVRVLLRGNYRNIVEARAFEHLADRLVTRAVEGSVNQLKLAL